MSRKGNCWDNASHGKLLGYIEAGMVKRPTLPHTRRSQDRDFRVYLDFLQLEADSLQHWLYDAGKILRRKACTEISSVGEKLGIFMKSRDSFRFRCLTAWGKAI